MGTVFVAGSVALDFVGTLNERWSSRVENLHSGEDVAGWLVDAGVLDELPSIGPEVLEEAIGLREALFGLARHLIDHPGEPLPEADVHRINAAAAHPPPVIQLANSGRIRRTGDWRAGLSAIARDGLALNDPGDAVLKWCADLDCTHPFLDRSRGHRRRWCEMAGCGDRAKAAAYRARQRQSRSSA